jgi:phosphopantetheine adenylyltransferase
MVITGRGYSVMTDERKIILITDLLESKKRKEEELEYYREQLVDLERRMSWVQQEIDLTNTIIDIIETETELLVTSSNTSGKNIENNRK